MVERQVEVHLGSRQHVADRGLVRPTPKHGHGALKHLQVHLEADGGDGPMLFGAQQVPSAPDLQVPQSDLESLTQLVQAGDDVQAFVGAFGERAARIVKKVRVRPAARAADAAAQLVELREPETIRALDHYRVHVGDVETRLDDGRADEHVELGGLEVHHHPGTRRRTRSAAF